MPDIVPRLLAAILALLTGAPPKRLRRQKSTCCADVAILTEPRAPKSWCALLSSSAVPSRCWRACRSVWRSGKARRTLM